MSEHKGPPPVGTAWANVQETRVVVHTNGNQLGYTVQFEVWRGFPELRRCGITTVNGKAWQRWMRFAEQCPHPAERRRDVGDTQHGAPGGAGRIGTVAGRSSVDAPSPVVGSRPTGAGVRGVDERQRVGGVAPNKQGPKGGR